VPPFDEPPAGGLRFDPVWRFVLDHPYWLQGGASPWAVSAPATVPKWCAPGVGKATAMTSCPY
jgi:hypothetical protein